MPSQGFFALSFARAAQAAFYRGVVLVAGVLEDAAGRRQERPSPLHGIVHASASSTVNISRIVQSSAMKRHLWLVLLAVALCSSTSPTSAARTVDFDTLTIADINRAFDAGALTSEKLVQLCLARIDAYDRKGPSLRAVLTLNPKALETARALDAERKAKGPRSPLHGIPIVLKDNYNTFDLPTTGGSVLLEGSIPPEDAFLVKKLRAAGAVVLAKLNMSEFASGPAKSSLGGQALNPHDLTRTPSGSSGGTGVAIAAAYAPLGFGTDTGGSIRGPSTSNGIAGLKPTHGLLSRSGIIPLSLSFDTGGPMARSVSDVAVALGLLTVVDPADAATKKSEGRFETDYTKYLKADALTGARIGIARDFLGADPDVDWAVDAALAAMRKAGATTVDVRYPKWLLDSTQEFYNAIRRPEFHVQIAEYQKTTGPGYPKTLEEMIERADFLTHRWHERQRRRVGDEEKLHVSAGREHRRPEDFQPGRRDAVRADACRRRRRRSSSRACSAAASRRSPACRWDPGRASICRRTSTHHASTIWA